MRHALAAIALTFYLWATWSAAGTGYSRWLGADGMERTQQGRVEEAARLSPSDPEAHYALANVFWDSGQVGRAAEAYERAAALRPRDYYLWLRLGYTRLYAGETAAGASALEQAARLAPRYAQPRRYLGIALLDLGRGEEAFAQLRLATKSDPGLLPEAAALAWEVYGGEAAAVERALRPQSAGEHIALADFLAERGRVGDAVRLFRAAGAASESRRRELLARLLDSGRFAEAHLLWSSLQPDGESRFGVGRMTDGGFEGAALSEERGFGWRLERRADAVQASIAVEGARGGARSLRIDYLGESSPSLAPVSQLILVEPGVTYELKFSARTQKVVSGGMPIVAVFGTGADQTNVLAQSEPLPKETGGWKEVTVKFAAPEEHDALHIKVLRQACAGSPCPIFGTLWLDDFELRRLAE